MSSTFAALADMFDPPPTAGVEPWLCDRPECDGLPHDGWDWKHARTKQRPPPGTWFLWMILAGRGFGKTRTATEWLTDQMARHPGSYWAWVAPTFDDGRDIGIEGESGMLFVLDRLKIQHDWNRSLGHLILRKTQARLDLFTAEKPESLRGPNLRGAVGDEPATWKYPDATWSNLLLMCRIGHPQIVVSGTPKPTRFVRDLRTKANHLTVGDTYENRANLADIWFQEVIAPLEGTALGQQEIYARILDQAAGALWRREWIRIRELDAELDRVRVAWDPAITSTAKSDQHGILAVGQEKPRKVATDDRGKAIMWGRRWVLDDRSGVLTPDAAAKRVVQLAVDVDAARVFYEPNQGGDVWEVLYKSAAAELKIRKPPPIEKRPAVGNKESRAAPVSQVYEQQHNLERELVFHLPGLAELELEMCTWEPGVTKESPNRVDALSLAWQALDVMRGTRRAGTTAQRPQGRVVRRSPRVVHSAHG